MVDIDNNKKFNMKLFPIYKMFAWDLLFYYAISFLFLTNVKGLSAAEVVLVDVSFYTFFKFLFQLPGTIIVDKFGKRTSLIMANIFICIAIFLILLTFNITTLILAEIFLALGYVIKSLVESNLLYDSIPKSDYRRRLFGNLDGKGSSLYYYLNALSSVTAGFLYIINPYLPIIICLIISVIATYLSTLFHDIHVNNINKFEKIPNPTQRIKEYFKELKYIFRYIFKSNRLRCLIIFYGLLQSLISLTATLDKSLLQDLSIQPEYFGIIYGLVALLSGIASYSQNIFHNIFRNKVLTIFAALFVLSCITSRFIYYDKCSF